MAQKVNQSQFSENLSHIRKIACRVFRSVFIGLLFWLNCEAQSPKAIPSVSPETDAFLITNQKSLGTNFVVLAYKDGKIAYKKEVEKEVGDFNGRSEAPAGNASQWLVAATVMAYVDEGKITLDDKVSKYIPIFATYMKTYITIRNCLSYSTGIKGDPPGPMKLLPKSKYQDLESEVNAFASKREIESNPGTEIYYSQIGADIAARVLEVITKKTFDRIVQDKILRPCKMRSTSFTNESGFCNNAFDGATTSAFDFINFLGMLLNKGTFEGKKVLSEKSVAEMEKIQFPNLTIKYIPKEATGLKIGLGCWTNAAATEISSLNIGGFWPYIDRQLNYAALIMPQKAEDPKKELYTQIKQKLDAAIGK
jgi:CubicO group peptidase (beta-lactamase class C family)